jgi:hypothetical protein
MGEESREEPKTEAAAETDPRFPSGRWKGYYIQWGMRGWQDLTLQFADGKIEGTATDKGGEAEIFGTYDLTSGIVSLVKIYYYHKVEYRGETRDKGIRGGFMIRYPLAIDAGEFYIWPAGEGGVNDNELAAAQTLEAR